MPSFAAVQSLVWRMASECIQPCHQFDRTTKRYQMQIGRVTATTIRTERTVWSDQQKRLWTRTKTELLTEIAGELKWIYFGKFNIISSFTQNYYYLLQRSEWRETNDWIHRESGQLQPLLVAFKHCSTRNIREQRDCLAFSIIDFFNDEIQPHLEKMRSIQPDAELLSAGLKGLTEKALTGLRQHNKTFWMYKLIYKFFYKIISEV